MSHSRRSHSLRAALLALGLTGAFAAGCNPYTYGTGETVTAASFREITGGLGMANKEPIEYEPRAPLVAPPQLALRPPVEGEAVRPADYPVETRVKAARRVDEGEMGADLTNEDLRRFRAAASQVERLPQQNRRMRGDAGVVRRAAEEMSREERQAFSQAMTEKDALLPTKRRFLTEPPLDYRQPAGTAPYAVAQEQEKQQRVPRFGPSTRK